MYNSRNEFLNKLATANFDSFDGEDNFDPENFDPENFDFDNATGQPMRKAVAKAKPVGSVAQFTISVVNAQSTNVTVELFQFIRSISGALNSNISALNPFTALDVASANANSLVYFDRAGNLIYQDSSGAKCTVSCKQLPYISLFKASGIFGFMVERIRMTVTNDGQIENDIVHVTNTFLGATKRNPISPRSFFSPNQFQSKTIDITAGFYIDSEKGIETVVNASETVIYNMYLRRYSKSGTLEA